MNAQELASLIHQSRAKFGQLLRELCDLGGVTVEKLSSLSVSEVDRSLIPWQEVGAMGPLPIAEVMCGLREPRYWQVYIWLKVLREHFESERLASICQEIDFPLPMFPTELETEIWHLAGYLAPQELAEALECNRDLKLIEIVEGEV